MDIYLACFDIEDDKARRKVGNILLEHGDRVQYSVFEISVKNVTMLDKIKRKCLYYLEDTDKLFFYYLRLYPSNLKMLGSARINWLSDKTPI